MSASLRIGDLIEVPPVRTVIRLEEGRTGSEEIARSFVFTSEVASHVAVIAEALLSGRGQGYFLQGDFGSGKSHFLAALYAWLAGGESRSLLSEHHGGLKRLEEGRKKFLPADISLINYRSSTPLETVVVTAAEERLSTTGGGRGGVPGGVPEGGPGERTGERLETFQRLLSKVKEAGYDGLFLLIDELSEFFRSKPTPQALNEDARTLQLLGELAAREQLWIVAAVQESVEATGDISQAILRKIKDRFPVKLGLSTLHIRSLIAGRLVRRKPGADAEIARIYEQFRSQFSTFTCSFEDFRSAYPVHPVTLSLLDGLGDLFSQHRGIVDFVYSRIAGDPRRNIGGILERPATELLGPDSIYEHFAQRIAEFSAFHAYPRRIVPHLDETIGAAIEAEEDRALARRLVRMLVLYRIHPTARAPNVSQLAELASCSLGGPSAALNARFVAEAILDPLAAAGRFLTKTLPESGDPLQAVYAITMEVDPGKLLEARIRRTMEDIAADDARLLVEPLSRLPESESWPGSAVWTEGAQRPVNWSASARKALVRFLHGEEQKPFADRLAYDITEQGFDCAVVLAIGEQACACPHTAVWRIALPPKNATLQEFLGAQMVAAQLKPSNPADAPLIPLSRERLARLSPAAFQAALEALYAGAFTDPRIRVDPAVRQLKRFDRLLEAAAEVLLLDRYPRFPEVAPRRASPSPRLYQQLLEVFVIPGSLPLTEARSRSLAAAIDGLAVPLGLVELKRGSYVFSPDTAGYPLLTHLFSLLSPSGPTPMAAVLAGLKGGPFGLQQDTAVFLIASLVAGGLLTALRGGRTIPLEYLNIPALEKAEELRLGELISEADSATLRQECLFLPSAAGWDSFGLKQQREAWKEVIKFRETTLPLIEDVRLKLARLSEFSSFQAFGIAHLEHRLVALKSVAEAVKISYQPKEGLERFLQAWRGTGLSSGDVSFLKKLARFLSEKAEEFVFINHYLRHTAVDKALSRERGLIDLRNTVVALLDNPEVTVVNDEGQHLAAAFGQFRDAYVSFYAREHAAFYQSFQRPPLSKAAQRALAVLSALAGIQTIDRPAGLEAFLGELAAGERRRCGRQISEELIRSPVCGCGFVPGDQPALPRKQAPEEEIDRLLRAYFAILANPRVLEAIAARAYALQDTVPAAAKGLKRLAETLRAEALSPAALVSAFDETTAAELAQALAGRIPIRQRRLADLAAGLAGRRLPPQRILALVSEWLADTGEDVLIAVEGDAASATAFPAPSFWPLLHGGLFSRSLTARAEEIGRWEAKLEEAFPAARLRESLRTSPLRELAEFIRTERLHTRAVEEAWHILAERVAGGQRLPEDVPLASAHADLERARSITGLLAAAKSLESRLAQPFPERLAGRLPIEELLHDPWTTEELASDLFAALEGITSLGESWLSGLAPVQAVDLSDAPVVVIADGVSPDVWLEALATASLPGERLSLNWSRLDAAPSTIDSLAALFALTGDPQEQLSLRDVRIFTLRGNEERSLKDQLLPFTTAAPAIVRLSLFDREAHRQRIRLSEMARILAELISRDLAVILQACVQEKRRLLLTTDHGLSLTREGLLHGKGGPYERAIFRAQWTAP